MRRLHSFTRAEEGNIAILFTFMFGMLLLFTGGAVDFSRRNAVRADLIESLDAAGLAMARLEELPTPELEALSGADREAYLKAYGRRFFYENFKHENQIDNLTVDFEITPQDITPTASGTIKTIFLGIGSKLNARGTGGTASLETLSMESSTQITRRGSGPIELALVLDVTGSMSESVGGTAKIQSLRDASDALLNVLYGPEDDATSDNVRVSVVPFNAYVNAGGAIDQDGDDAWDDSWSDTEARASYHGARFIHVTETGAVDPAVKVNHFHLFDSNASFNWKGCTEAKPYPLDEIDAPVGVAAPASAVSSYNVAPTGTTNTLVLNAFSGAPAPVLPAAEITSADNSRFVPLFNLDEVNCNSGGNLACGYTTSPNPATRAGITYNGGWFDNPSNDSPSRSGYQNSYVNDKAYVRDNTTNFTNYLIFLNYTRQVQKTHLGGSCGGSPDINQTNPEYAAFLQRIGAVDACNDEYIVRMAYPGRFDPATERYLGKYNLSVSIDETIDEAAGDQSTRGPNRNCSSPILVNSDAKEPVKDHIHSLAPAGNTNSAEGMMWGWRVLSPESPFESEIPYDDERWQKAVVLMTDGNNVVSSSSMHWRSAHSAYGYATEERMGDNLDTQSEMENEVDNKLLRICARMKAEGILIYTITFGLADTGAELATKQTFRACAAEPEAPYYFDAPDGEELEDAFADIAADLVQLHVSR